MDEDGDGWGDAEVVACEGAAGFASARGDCDDAQPDVHPQGGRDCDGRDEDCDGEVDEVPSWLDVDRDGYGDSSYGHVGCPVPEGYALHSRDCDEADDAIHPGAAETWYDGIDQDCDGRSDWDADIGGDDATSFGGLDGNDTDAAVNWDAGEVCANAVDDNCDGRVDVCVEDPSPRARRPQGAPPRERRRGSAAPTRTRRGRPTEEQRDGPAGRRPRCPHRGRAQESARESGPTSSRSCSAAAPAPTRRGSRRASRGPPPRPGRRARRRAARAARAPGRRSRAPPARTR